MNGEDCPPRKSPTYIEFVERAGNSKKDNNYTSESDEQHPNTKRFSHQHVGSYQEDRGLGHMAENN